MQNTLAATENVLALTQDALGTNESLITIIKESLVAKDGVAANAVAAKEPMLFLHLLSTDAATLTGTDTTALDAENYKYALGDLPELTQAVQGWYARRYGVAFLYRDFRPGFRQGQQEARELGLYMQKYCGCVFSEEERYAKQIARDMQTPEKHL